MHSGHPPAKIDIVVVGSINMDLLVSVRRAPEIGETIIGKSMDMLPGGKGANQAVAAARLGGRTAMVGRVGSDPFGAQMRRSLADNGVFVDRLRVSEASTGIAIVTVEEDGDNHIIVIPGANGELSEEDVRQNEDRIRQCEVVLLQLEIPLATVRSAVRAARDSGKLVILDPAPAAELDAELLGMVDILVPNESEAAWLTGMNVTDLGEARRAASELLSRGVRQAVLLKLGARGALIGTADGFVHVEGFPVNAVDTTAAGDTFAGALAVALVEKMDLASAVRFANAAAALSTTARGAQSSIPDRAAVEKMLKRS